MEPTEHELSYFNSRQCDLDYEAFKSERSLTMERKLKIESEKNAYMRAVVDVICHPTDR